MKQNLIMVLAAGLFVLSAASVASAQDGLGISVGYVSSASITKGPQDKSHSPLLNGIRVGASYDLNITKNFMFQPGLYYSYLTDKRKIGYDENPLVYVADLMNEHFMNIPLHFKYSFRISDEVTGLYIFAGPTMTIGLSSKSEVGIVEKESGEYLGSAKYDYYSRDISFKDITGMADKMIQAYLPMGAYRRFDIAMGAGIGVEIFDYLDVKLGYDWGLMNRMTGDAASDYKTHRNQFYVTAGVRF